MVSSRYIHVEQWSWPKAVIVTIHHRKSLSGGEMDGACTDCISLLDDPHEGDGDPVYAAACSSKDPGPVAARDQALTVDGNVL